MTRSGFGLTRPAWALAYGLPRAPATNPRAKAPRWREGSSKADRGRRLHGPWLRGSASHDANGIRRARKPGPIRRPRASDRSGAPLAARPQARESSKKSKFMGGKKFKQNLGWAAESARDSSLVSTVVEILTITVFGDPEKKRDSHDNCFW